MLHCTDSTRPLGSEKFHDNPKFLRPCLFFSFVVRRDWLCCSACWSLPLSDESIVSMIVAQDANFFNCFNFCHLFDSPLFHNHTTTKDINNLSHCLLRTMTSSSTVPSATLSSTMPSPSSSNFFSMRRIPVILVLSLLATTATTTTAFTSPSDIPGRPHRSPSSSSSSSSSSPSSSSTTSTTTTASSVSLEQLRQDWAERSVSYYSKIMREERRRNSGQVDQDLASSPQYQHEFQILAKKHYFALRKIKDGQYTQAELIYKRIINEILNENEDEKCDHAKLAVTTLLLALHCQRMGDMKKTRSVFLSFFRVVTMKNSSHGHHNHDHDHDQDHHVVGNSDHPQCACSAKVLGAFALFEMKQGNKGKAFQIVQKAVEFDPSMKPVLNWKQFREVGQRLRRRRRRNQQQQQQQQQQTR